MLEALAVCPAPASGHLRTGGDPSFHPGKCAALLCNGQALGVFGELHPLVKQQFDFLGAPVIAADLDLEALLAIADETGATRDVPAFPPTLEDIAVVVDEEVPAEQGRSADPPDRRQAAGRGAPVRYLPLRSRLVRAKRAWPTA